MDAVMENGTKPFSVLDIFLYRNRSLKLKKDMRGQDFQEADFE